MAGEVELELGRVRDECYPLGAARAGKVDKRRVLDVLVQAAREGRDHVPPKDLAARLSVPELTVRKALGDIGLRVDLFRQANPGRAPVFVTATGKFGLSQAARLDPGQAEIVNHLIRSMPRAVKDIFAPAPFQTGNPADATFLERHFPPKLVAALPDDTAKALAEMMFDLLALRVDAAVQPGGQWEVVENHRAGHQLEAWPRAGRLKAAYDKLMAGQGRLRRSVILEPSRVREPYWFGLWADHADERLLARETVQVCTTPDAANSLPDCLVLGETGFKFQVAGFPYDFVPLEAAEIETVKASVASEAGWLTLESDIAKRRVQYSDIRAALTSAR